MNLKVCIKEASMKKLKLYQENYPNKGIIKVFKRLIDLLMIAICLTTIISCTLLQNDNDDNTPVTSQDSVFSGSSLIDLSKENINIFKVANDKYGNTLGFLSTHETNIFIIELETAGVIDSGYIGDSFGSSNSADFKDKFEAVSGSGTEVKNIEVDPITKRIYILGDTGKLYKVIISGNVTNIEAVDLSSVKAAKINVTNHQPKDDGVMDFSWDTAESYLYVSYGNHGQLRHSRIAWIKAPFNKEEVIVTNDQQTNSMGYREAKFTSGSFPRDSSTYTTSAPVEKMSVTVIDGTSFLTGVNTCSPGFSLPTSEIRSSFDPITFVQTFNMGFNSPIKSFHYEVTVSNKKDIYYFILYSSTQEYFERIGSKYIDGSYNNDDSKSGANVDVLEPMNPHRFPNPITEGEYKKTTLKSGEEWISGVPYYSEEKLLFALKNKNNDNVWLEAVSAQ